MLLTRQEAQKRNHDYICTEHILLGLVEEGSGVAVNALRNLNINLENIRAEVEKHIKIGLSAVGETALPFTPLGKRTLEISAEEANYLGCDYIGSEHLLLGLIRVQDGLASKVLRSMGITAESVRTEIARILGCELPKYPPPPPTLQRKLAVKPSSSPPRIPLWVKMIILFFVAMLLLLIVFSFVIKPRPQSENTLTLAKGFAAHYRSCDYMDDVLAIEETDYGIIVFLNVDYVPLDDRKGAEESAHKIMESLIHYSESSSESTKKETNAIFLTLKSRKGDTLGKGCYTKAEGWTFNWNGLP